MKLDVQYDFGVFSLLDSHTYKMLLTTITKDTIGNKTSFFNALVAVKGYGFDSLKARSNEDES